MSDKHDLATWFAEHYPEGERTGHKLFAQAFGYFWAPCPLCKVEFGGHEWRDIDGKVAAIPVSGDPRRGTAICPTCTRAGKGHR